MSNGDNFKSGPTNGADIHTKKRKEQRSTEGVVTLGGQEQSAAHREEEDKGKAQSSKTSLPTRRSNLSREPVNYSEPDRTFCSAGNCSKIAKMDSALGMEEHTGEPKQMKIDE